SLTRFVTILDSVIYGFPTALTLFLGADGLESLIGRISNEVDFCCSQNKNDIGVQMMDDVVVNLEQVELPHQRTAFLRSMLKFVLHMMQTSGTADRMRNLIDTSLPSSIDIIFKNAKQFGFNVFGLAVNIMSTFIHNEPTSLSILQEAKIPNSFLEAVCNDIPVSTEVVSALPNAFGAICLNPTGLELFNQFNPIERFLSVFTSEEHLNNLIDPDIPPLIGSSMDELIRHHPSLKDKVLSSIIGMLAKIIEMGEEVTEEDKEICFLIKEKEGEDVVVNEDEKKSVREPRIAQFVDVASRFLEGLFQNASHCKDFLKLEGLQLLLKIYSLPSISYDFPSCAAANSLSFLFRIMVEVNPAHVVNLLGKEVEEILKLAMNLISNENGVDSEFAKYIDTKGLDYKTGDAVYRSLVVIHGFSCLIYDLFCAHMTNSRGVTAVTQMFASPDLLLLLGQVHRLTVLENILLKNAVPKTWYNKKPATDSNNTTSESSTVGNMSDPIKTTPSTTSSIAQVKDNIELSENDRRVKNTGFFKHLLTQIPIVLTPFFQTIIKILTTRRIQDNTQRKTAQKIVETLGDLLRSSLNWERIDLCKDKSVKNQYLLVMLSFLSDMIKDERNQVVIQSALIIPLLKSQGMESLLQITSSLWSECLDNQIKEPSENATDSEKEQNNVSIICLESSLKILHDLVNAKFLPEPTNTGLLLLTSQPTDDEIPFNQHDFFVERRINVLNLMKDFWGGPFIAKMPTTIIRSVLMIFMEILNSKGEVNEHPEVPTQPLSGLSQLTSLTGLMASMLGRAAPSGPPDEAAVAQLVEMGFLRASAETALTRTGNHINRAAEYILTHPELTFQTSTAPLPITPSLIIPTLASTLAPSTPVLSVAGASTDDAIAGTSTSSGTAQVSTSTPVTSIPELLSESGSNPILLPIPSVESQTTLTLQAPEENSALTSEILSEVQPMETDPNPTETVIEAEHEIEDEEAALAAALAMSMEVTSEVVQNIASSENIVEEEEEEEEDSDDEEQNAEDESAQLQSVNKGKEKAKEKRKILEDARTNVRGFILETGLKLIDVHESLVFLIKDLLCLLNNDDISNGVEWLLKEIYSISDMMEDISYSKRRIGRRYRLLALLANDPKLQDKTIKVIQPIFPKFLDLIENEARNLTEGKLDSIESSSLSSILLVLEAYISVFDEPHASVLKKIPLELESTTNEEKPKESQQSSNILSSLDIGKNQNPMEFAARLQLLETVVKLLKIQDIDHDLLNVLLRITLRLTRAMPLASAFVDLGGIPILLKPDRMGCFPAQLKITIMIVRHIIDVPSILQALMEKNIISWFNFQRTRVEQIGSFIRNLAHVICRDPEIFVAAVEKTCAIAKYDANPSRSTMLKLKKNPNDENVEEQSKGETKRDIVVDLKSDSGEDIVQHLVTDIIFLKDKKDDIKSDGKLENFVFNHRIWCLQYLTELVTSYPSSKIHVLGTMKGKASVSAKNLFISYLLNELLPTPFSRFIVPSDEQMSRRKTESEEASYVIATLCISSFETFEAEQQSYPELNVVRGTVLDAIQKAMKDSLTKQSDVTTDLQYGRFFAYADLTHKILAVPQHFQRVQNPDVNSHTDLVSNIAKMMLERDFVGLFTSMLSEIEIQHPAAKKLTEAIIKPLESLSLSAIKISRMVAAVGDVFKIEKLGDAVTAQEATSLASSDTAMVIETTVRSGIDTAPSSAGIFEEDLSINIGDTSMVDSALEAREEANLELSDIYRHSALGILDPRDNANMDDSESDEEEGFDEFDDDEMSGSGDDEESDDDMVIMGTGPYHGAGGDMEEDDEEEEEEEDDDDDDDDDEEEVHEIVVGDDDDMWDDLEDGEDEEIPNEEINGEVEVAEGLEEDEEDEEEQEDSEEDGEEEIEDEDIEDEPLNAGIDEIFEQIEGEEEEIVVPVGGRFRSNRNRVRRQVGRRSIFELGMFADRVELNWTANPPITLAGVLNGDSRNTHDEQLTHPLLQNQNSVGIRGGFSRNNVGADLLSGPGGIGRHGFPRPAGNALEGYMQAFTDLLGDNARDMLESAFARGGRGRAFELTVSQNGFGTNLGLMAEEINSPTTLQPGGRAGVESGESKIKSQIFAPRITSKRWQEEAELMYGANYSEKSSLILNEVLNRLYPSSVEEERKRKEKELAARKLKEEEETKRKEEEETKAIEKKKLAEEEAATAVAAAELAATTATELETVKEDENMDIVAETVSADITETAVEPMDISPPIIGLECEGQSSSSVVVPAAAEINNTTTTSAVTDPEPERIIVVVNGAEVDITGSGIDPTFLEALPEDLRQEVISQHIREQRQLQQQSAERAGRADINNDFLEALPPDIRDEVLAQERRETERRSRATQETANNGGPVELDPASFLATLDDQLRQEVLLDNDNLLAGLPPDLVAEANLLRRRVRRMQRQVAETNSRTNQSSLRATNGSNPKKQVHRDAVQLVDRQSLMTLIKFLFVPEPISRELLHKLLGNLCENYRTRMELVSLLLSILSDGSGDLGAVDKSFSLLSLKGKGKLPVQPPTTPKKATSPISNSSTTNGESIPNLIATRTLEILMYLITSNDHIVQFFLSESESFSQTFVKHLRLSNRKNKGKDKVVPGSKYPYVVLLSLVERQSFLSNSMLMEQLMSLLAILSRPLAHLINKKTSQQTKAETSAEPVVITEEATTLSVQPPESTLKESENSKTISDENKISQPAPLAPTVKLPAIPDQSLKAVVNVLTTGECTNKTFQFTLQVLQYLSLLGNNRSTISHELTESAQKLCDFMIGDLEVLSQIISNAVNALDVQAGTLSKFSLSSSQQARFLRVLKALDFLYSKAPLVRPTTTPEKPISSETGRLNATKLTQENSEVCAELVVIDDMATAVGRLKGTDLWKNLGETLVSVSQKPDLVHIATILLPLIEAFMVVSKPFINQAILTSQSPTAINNTQTNFQPSQATSNLQRTSTIRSIKDFKDLSHEDIFITFTEDHRKILNTMVRNNPSLMSGSFSLLIHNPKVLEFDNKRAYFNQQLHKRTSRDQYEPIQLNVRRQYVFEDSYHQLQGRNGNEIKYAKLGVHFYEEEGVDAGGVTREWFTVLARQMFNPNYALFKPSAADKVTYQPNRSSWINPEHLSYFKFVGRIIGKAIYDGRLLDCYFTRSFYKCVGDIPVDWRDMEAIDPEFHKSLEWILNNDITDILDLNFTVEIDDFGNKKVVELKPDGNNIPVSELNKHEYVKLITEQKLTKAIRDQIDAFLSGFYEIIPKELVKIFNEQELELLISGMPDIDIDDWKNNTEYQNYTASTSLVQWFWRAVRSFSQEERAKLIQFVTGTSKIPLEGFSHLQGSGGVQKFQIHKDFSSTNRLPSAHTCFNQLDLPQYESYEQLRTSLLTAISECGT
ncbi:hypothetical protein HK096_007058, partial [Nowakowskiella sp. JEL0078]